MALAVLLVATGAGYAWNLGAKANGNAFYAAAVQAGTKNWTAFFFGSLDSANLITVDKPPAALWVMELSGRIFGFGTWSMLLPQVLMAVVAVATLYATVRRVAGPVPGLLAGALLALTPVAYSMFRFNDPDALLVLLLTVAAYCTMRAVQTARTGWLVLTGLLVGLAFLTKEFQALLAVPGLALAYLWAAPASLGRRTAQLAAAAAALMVGAGWWVLASALTPASERPYIAGSSDNSELGRALGYNGLSRILGFGSQLSASQLGIVGDQPGITRMFSVRVSGYIAWLLPAAVILLVAGLWLTRRAPRTDAIRATLVLFGGWLIVGGLVLSLMKGLFHEYYTLVLAPPIVGCAVVGGWEAWEAWRRREVWTGRVVLAGTVAVTAATAAKIVARKPATLPIPARAVLVVGLLVALAPTFLAARQRWAAGLVAAAVVLGAAGPVALATVSLASGITASAAPRPDLPAAPRPGLPAAPRPGLPAGFGHRGRVVGRLGVRPIGRIGRNDNRAIAALLASAGTRWSAATTGSSAAATFELASNTAVMAIGGYAGTDPVPTLRQFQTYVRAGLVRYFVIGGPTGGPGSVGAQIAAWVEHHFRGRPVDNRGVFDLLPGRRPVI